MKCVCGYEYDFDLVTSASGGYEKSIIKGDVNFLSINVTLTIDLKYGPARSVRTFACPKCGTLKIEI